MESGISSDQNFWAKPSNRQSDAWQSEDDQYDPYTSQFGISQSQPPKIPPKVSLHDYNTQAVVSNGVGDFGRDADSAEAFYRPMSPATNSNGSTMAQTAGLPSSTRDPSSFLRSNGNGSTPKYPSLGVSRNARLSSGGEDTVGPSHAKSSPHLNDLAARPRQISSSRVQEIAKRFDTSIQQADAPVRKTPGRIPARDMSSTSAGYSRGHAISSPRAGGDGYRAGQMTRDLSGDRGTNSPVGRPTQRSRFASEDQHSNNTLSSVPRISKPRTDMSVKSQASASMTNLSPPVPPKALQSPARKALFGEVVQTGASAPGLGYGILEARNRRTSESSLHPPGWNQHMGQTNLEPTPASPTDWYRNASPPPNPNNLTTPRQPSKAHTRSHSDLSGTNSKNNALPAPFSSTSRSAASPSRLPVFSKRSNASSDTTSPPTSRSASPYTSKANMSSGASRKNEPRPWSPAGRAVTPVHRSTGRQSVSPGKAAIPNSSLKAYISSPEPKQSPSLRSSRPRQGVSTATTASSRGNSGSPQPSGVKVKRGGEDSGRVNGGKIDYAARRKQIQQSFTKSIHESEERELRAKELRRLAEAEELKKSPLPSLTSENVAIQESQSTSPRLEAASLVIDTSFLSPDSSYSRPGAKGHSNPDSPTLGMPGTFPAATAGDSPHSAISNATGFTEFENEPQTEAPLRRGSPREAFNDNGSIQIILDTTPIQEPNSTSSLGLPQPAFSVLGDSQGTYTGKLNSAIPDQALITSLELNNRTLGHNASFANKVSENNHTSAFGVQDFGTASIQENVISNHQDQEPNAPNWNGAHSRLPPLTALQTALSTQYPDSSRLPGEYLDTPVTDIEYESSEGIDDYQQDRYTDHHAGRLSASGSARQRMSYHSAWTNDTVNSSDEVAVEENRRQIPPIPFIPISDLHAPNPPPKEESIGVARPDVPPKPDSYSPQPSPRGTGDTPQISSPTQSFYSARDNAGMFPPSEATDTSQAAINTSLHWPSYDPPPPPQISHGDRNSIHVNHTPAPPSLYSRHTQSSIGRLSHSGTNVESESRRESEDTYSARPSISTPRSSAQISLNESGDISVPEVYEDAPSQDTLRADPSILDVQKAWDKLEFRRHTLNELVHSEATFLKDMNVVQEIYKGTADACPNLESGDISLLFRNIHEIVSFSTRALQVFKAAAAPVYNNRRPKEKPKVRGGPAPGTADATPISEPVTPSSVEARRLKDSETTVGAAMLSLLPEMRPIFGEFVRRQPTATERLKFLKNNPTVSVWLKECDFVAKDLTNAWNLDTLIIKPFQRVLKYPLLYKQLVEATPEDHPDHKSLHDAFNGILDLVAELNKSQTTNTTVAEIVTRKRKDSDVRTGMGKIFVRREKTASRDDDPVYLEHHSKFSDNYLHLQVVLRDIEFYTRQCSTNVQEFLQYLSAIELVMRSTGAQGQWAVLESKWIQFNLHMRTLGSVGLVDHVAAIKTRVIKPIEQAIKAHEPPSVVMKFRTKRLAEHERYKALRDSGKKIDEKTQKAEDDYQDITKKLKEDLPKLSAKTKQIGGLCSAIFVEIMTEWYNVWQQKLKTVFHQESDIPKNVEEIVIKFQRDFAFNSNEVTKLGIVSGNFGSMYGRQRLSNAGPSGSEANDDSYSTHSRSKPAALSSRNRGMSVNSDYSPSLPTPDFVRGGQFSFSPLLSTGPGLPQFNTRDFPPQSRPGSGSPATADSPFGSRPTLVRPTTSRSYDSGGPSRESADNARSPSGFTSTAESAYWFSPQVPDSAPASSRPLSGLFNSAMPPTDGPMGLDGASDSRRSSRASSYERERSNGYNVLYLAASLFEFNIDATKSEAGYPYLTYQAGEIFDVIGEKGELWLAKNQDDPSDLVGWIWSKHFARLATD